MDVKPIYWRPGSQNDGALNFKAGVELFERFSLVRHLGSGGFGCVWEAHDNWLDHRVALKLSHDDLSDETLVLRMLPKDRFISIFDYVQTNSSTLSAYSMEILAIPWTTLEKYHHKTIEKNMAIPAKAIIAVRTAICIAIDILQTLSSLHGKKHGKKDRWCHGDIKPNNVYVNNRVIRKALATKWGAPRPSFIKIGDLGLAREKGTLLMAGTPGFMAPEQNGSKCVSPTTDVYSVAQTLLCLITGAPFSCGDIAHISRLKARLNASIPSGYLADSLAETVRKMTLTVPSQRLTAEASIEMLRKIVAVEEDWYIMSKFSGDLAQGATFKQAADALYPEVNRLYGWSKKTAPRLEAIKVNLRSTYRRGMLSRKGISYYLA